MTVKDLKKALSYCTNDAHVVVAAMTPMVVTNDGRKLEIHDVWGDGTGVINVIATTQACEVDPELRKENNL